MSEPPDLSGLDALTTAVNPVAVRFDEAGFRLYLVGGVVRDLVLAGAKPFDLASNDIDLTTDAMPDDIKRLLAPVADAVWAQGERFGTIGAKVGGQDLEITTHRAEAYDPESRKPIVTFGRELTEDLSRRDFTINAAAIELPSKKLHDPHNGVADLAAKALRTPLSPGVSFGDDPLRMMRAARFIARFGLEPAEDLVAAAIELRERLQIVSIERVTDELNRLLAVPDPTAGLQFLTHTGLLSQILPELGQADQHESVGLAAAPGSALVRLAGLLWPLGVEAPAALDRLKYSRADAGSTAKVITAVLRGSAVGAERSTARRLVADVGYDHFDDVRQLASNLQLTALLQLLDELHQSEDLSDLGSPLSGSEIMGLIGLEEGPDVGKAHNFLRELRLSNGPLSVEDARQALLDWWAGS